jgi:hypothetical protein
VKANTEIVDSGGAVGGSFDGYYEPYVEKVWEKYQGSQMIINTQAGSGILAGSVNSNGELVIGKESFSKPNTADIFGCNSGPFTTGPSPDRNAIIPRLAAAFVRSTLLEVTDLVRILGALPFLFQPVLGATLK